MFRLICISKYKMKALADIHKFHAFLKISYEQLLYCIS
jgi:hypothetical protein